MRTRGTSIVCVGFALACGCVLASCRKSERPSDTPAKTSDQKSAAVDLASDAEIVAKLAKADALDGTSDRMIMRCAGCRLRMDGSAEHQLKVAGFKMRFCSEACKTGFAENTAEKIRNLEIPEG